MNKSQIQNKYVNIRQKARTEDAGVNSEILVVQRRNFFGEGGYLWNRSYLTLWKIMEHVSVSNKGDQIARTTQCGKCGKRFQFMDFYRQHTLVCVGNGYFCRRCQPTFKDISVYKQHGKISY